MMHFAAPLLAYAALVGPSSPRAPVPRSAVRMADSGPIAQALKEKLKGESLAQTYLQQMEALCKQQ